MAIHGDVAVEASLRRKWKAARAAHANGERALVAIMGPSGQAKTQMVAVLARDEGVPVVKVDCSGMREPGDYFGMPSLENGSSVLIPSDLLRVLRSSEPVIVLLDEANRAEIEANNVLLPILDGSGTVTVPQTGKVETVNPFAFFVLTANVGSEYVGTQPWDEAFRTRITTPLHVEYPTADEETKIVRERYPDVSEYDAGNLVALANLLRENADSDGYPAPSTRQVLSAAMHIVHGLSAKEAAETIVDSLQREGGAHSERAKAAVHLNGIVWKEPTPAQKAEAEAAAAAAAEPVTHDTLCENASCGHALAYHGLNPRGQWVAPMGRPVGGCVVCPPHVCTISPQQKHALDQRIARS